MPDIKNRVLHLWDKVTVVEPAEGHECYRLATGTIVRMAPSSSGVDVEVVFDNRKLGAHLLEPSEVMVI